MEELKKEIQSLKKQTLYLWVIVISLVTNTIFFNFGMMKNYSIIQDYYYDSLDLDRAMNQNLDEAIQKIEENRSSIQ